MIPLGILASSIRLDSPESPLVDEYLNAEEFTHDWSDLVGWTTEGVQVQNNRLYGVSGGNPVATGHAFSVGQDETVMLTAEIVETSTTNGTRYVGINFGGSNDGVTASLPNFIGIGIGVSSRRPCIWIGSNFSGQTSGNTFLDGGLASGSYRVFVVADVENISLVLRTLDGKGEWSYCVPRTSAPNGGAATSVIVWNGATNGTAGSYIKAIGVRKSITPFRTKFNQAGTIEGDVGLVIHRQVSDGWRLQFPKTRDGLSPSPVVLFSHQANTGDRNSPVTESRWGPLREALDENGYVLLSADDMGDRWGNPASVANHKSLLAWMADRAYTGSTHLLGYSMGGLVAQNLKSNADINPATITLISPVCDLVAMRGNPSFTQSIDNAWGSSDEESLIIASQGYNPLTTDPQLFGGASYIFNVGANDTTVPAEAHSDLMIPRIEPYAESVAKNVLGSGHGPAESFDPTVIIPFINSHR